MIIIVFLAYWGRCLYPLILTFFSQCLIQISMNCYYLLVMRLFLAFWYWYCCFHFNVLPFILLLSLMYLCYSCIHFLASFFRAWSVLGGNFIYSTAFITRQFLFLKHRYHFWLLHINLHFLRFLLIIFSLIIFVVEAKFLFLENL